MTKRAFILIETEGGDSKNVGCRLKELEGVKTANVVTGPYDVIVEVELDNLNDLGIVLIDRIPYIRGISRMVTCLTMVGC